MIARTKIVEHLADMHQCAAWLSPLERVGLPVDVGRIVAFLASDAAGWISGKILGLDGGAFR